MHRRLAAGVVLVAGTASAAIEGPGMTQFMHAQRTERPIQLDGRLDEPEWATAPVFSDFVQSFPNEGDKPTERTEVRVLYDDTNLYVGVICFDSHPEAILRRLGRRDNQPASDSIAVAIDSAHDHRTAYQFQVSASGVLTDGLWFDGNNFTTDWDAVWDARAAMRSDGWSAEFVIPLSILRFVKAPEMTWGFALRREVAHKHETDDSVLFPRAANQVVQRFGHLTDLSGVQPVRDLELSPYVTARATWRPQYSDPYLPHPRLLDPSADVGLDVKAGLLSHLTLNATLNPDFGQVEADQIILNLTTYEPFFPEKRPFFTQGMDLFQPVGATNTQQLFYSRRIGLNQPIFAAGKVTGSVTPGLEVGVLDAVVGGWAQPAYANVPAVDGGYPTQLEAVPDRGFGLHATQPLTFAPNDAFTETPITPMNYFVAVARKQIFDNSTVGATVTSAEPLTGGCSEATYQDISVLNPTPGCLAHGGNTAGIDWNLRSPSGDWQFYGQVDGSQEVGGPSYVVQYDGTILRPGDLGYGTYFTAGKLGGEPFRFDVSYEYESPKLDLNALGYLRTQNQQVLSFTPRLFKTELGPFHNFQLQARGQPRWSTDGLGTYRGGNYSVQASAVLPGYHYLGCESGRDEQGYEIREIQYAGIPLERRPGYYLACWGQSDRNRPLSLNGFAAAAWAPSAGPSPHAWGYGGNLGLTWRPHSRLETQLILNGGSQPIAAHYVETLGAAPGQPQPFLFADVDSKFLSWTFRQLLVLTPRLTLQAYAQLFAAYGQYGPYYEAVSSGGAIHSNDMMQISNPFVADPYFEYPDFHVSALNVNVVLRWEYRLGSLLYFVYTHSQGEYPYAINAPNPADVAPDNLFRGGAADVFQIKWSYWWNG